MRPPVLTKLSRAGVDLPSDREGVSKALRQLCEAAIALLLVALAVSSASCAQLPVNDLSQWTLARRGEATVSQSGLELRGKMALWTQQRFGDLDLTVRARMHSDGEIWLRFRYSDDNTHYALALRGNNCNDLLLFRFSPGGEDRLLSVQPLGFTPRPEVTYQIRVVAKGAFLSVWVGDDPRPRLRVTDDRPLGPGLIGLGGGPFSARFESVQVTGQPTVSTGTEQEPSPEALRVNFQPMYYTLVDGYLPADGSPYTHERGYGWTSDMTSLMRERKLNPDKRRDTVAALAHGTYSATFVLECRRGDYVLTMVGGDPGFASHMEVDVQGETVPSVNLELRPDTYHVLQRPVTVTDGKFQFTFRARHPESGSGGALNWFSLEPRATVPDKYAAVSEQWRAEQAAQALTQADTEARSEASRLSRAGARAAYRPLQLPSTQPGRTRVDLGGNWLLLPDQDRPADLHPYDPTAADDGWHVMPVPAFLKPANWWIYAPNEGTSDNRVRQEKARCDALTFDYDRTTSAWYRQWLQVPADYAGKSVRLRFGAVATTCEVWLNGQHLGGHVGMFAPFELDATSALRPGQLNSLTVLASQTNYQGTGDPAEVLGVAVTVQITRDMLTGLPHGMYNRNLGIWQPVELVVTDPLYLREVQVTPSLTGLDADVTFGGAQVTSVASQLAAVITDRKTGETLYRGTKPVTAGQAPQDHYRLQVADLKPKLWSPEQPNLYNLELTLSEAASGKVLDRLKIPVGFRTFEVRGNRLYLNGQPYWLRGANHCPSGLKPNDPKLAHTFLRLMHEGNTMITRTHGSSFTETWLNAADEEGVGVSMEGIWPWVNIDNSAVISPDLVQAWKAEWIDILRAMRNHPCILMWTLNNESYWYRDTDPTRRAEKWRIATELIHAMRQADPSRPIVPDSGYVRDAAVYAREVGPAGYDDGDIDDTHQYFGWYSASPFALYGRKIEARFTGTRPAISQEFSQGYPNNDSGHPTRKYIDQHYVPQAWCGDWAYEDRDAGLFLSRHAFLSKELAELARRERDKLCGLLHFANTNWWRNSYDADRITPYPAYEAMQTALQPVLVSLELRNRHYFAGDTLAGRVCVVNDDRIRGDLPESLLLVRLEDSDGRSLAQTRVTVPATPYYANTWCDLSLKLPTNLPAPKGTYRLRLELRSRNEVVSKNTCELLLAMPSWVQLPSAPGLRVIQGSQEAAAQDPDELSRFVQSGGKVLVLNAGGALKKLLPEVVADYRARVVEIANIDDEAHPAFDGLEPLDLSWLNVEGDGVPHVCEGAYVLKPQAGAKVLAYTVWPHGYLKKPEDLKSQYGVTCFEITEVSGTLIAVELSDYALQHDPVAARYLANLKAHLSSEH